MMFSKYARFIRCQIEHVRFNDLGLAVLGMFTRRVSTWNQISPKSIRAERCTQLYDSHEHDTCAQAAKWVG